jgi:DNA-binding XRE family transcriptional regulator
MGGPESGQNTDPDRRRAADLRAQGLTFAEVGRWLGVSREAVRKLVLAAAGRSGPPVRVLRGPPRGGRCPACVAADPAAPLAERLRALRQAAGLTQAVLAARVGVSEPAVSAYECGRARPRSAGLADLARVLGPALTAGASRPIEEPDLATPATVTPVRP